MSGCGCEVNGQLIVGQEVTFTGSVIDSNGNAANPDSVTIKVLLPDNTTEILSPITNPSTGVFQVSFVLPQVGSYTWQFYGSGSFIALGEQVFMVVASAFP